MSNLKQTTTKESTRSMAVKATSSELIRDTLFGHILRFVTGRRVLKYQEEIHLDLWKKFVSKHKSGNIAHHGAIEDEVEKDCVNDQQQQPPSRRSSSDTQVDHNVINEVSGKKVDPEKGRDAHIVDWWGLDDPENPQNWSTFKKFFVTFEITFLTFAVYIGSAIYSAGIEDVGSNFTNVALTSYHTQTGTYNISTQFCMPDSMAKGWGKGNAPIVQVLTHGIGFDKTYWDFNYNNFNYSYVNVATDGYGYCTLAYDRLGIGKSSHGEPRDEIQSFLEEAALHELVTMLHAGTFPSAKQQFEKVIGVGHSFGSAQTYMVSNSYPTDFDAIVLTGFTMNASFVGLFVAGANFIQANQNTGEDLSAYPNGYLVSSDIGANMYLFFYSGGFDVGVLEEAEANKKPLTVGEALSLGSLVMENAYAGPVFVIDGDHDLPYCGGDCVNTGNPALPNIGAAVKMNFPAASSFASYIQPNTGHGLNFHYNATAGYDVIQNWLASVGV